MKTNPIIECELCPRRCRLPDGARGDCRVRININGQMQTLVYGTPCAVHVDPIEKKPVFHVLPASRSFSIATAGCNLHCRYCQNWQISQSAPEDTTNQRMTPEEVVAAATTNHCRSIAYTYSEPIIFYEYTYDTARLAHEQGLLNVLVTAGYINQPPLKELCPYIDAANVDLKGITDDFYQRMSGALLKPVQDAIVTMKQMGVWVEITNLIVPSWNDSDHDLQALCRWVADACGRDTPVHFSKFWPTHQLANLPPTPEATLNRAWDIARAEGLEFVYIGNIPGHPGNSTRCPGCGNLLIERAGYTILKNTLLNGSCPACGQRIPGRWT